MDLFSIAMLVSVDSMIPFWYTHPGIYLACTDFLIYGGGSDEFMEMTPKPDEIEPTEEGPNEGIDMSEAGPTDLDTELQDAGLKICFIVKGKKSYLVGIESPGEENASGDQYQEFDNSADALREVLRAAGNGGSFRVPSSESRIPRAGAQRRKAAMHDAVKI